MCPGKASLKVDTSFPVSRFRVFYRNLYSTADKNAVVTADDHPEQNQPLPAASNRTPRHFIDIYHMIV